MSPCELFVIGDREFVDVCDPTSVHLAQVCNSHGSLTQLQKVPQVPADVGGTKETTRKSEK